MTLKQCLHNKDKLYGAWCTIPSITTADIISKVDNMDFIIIDMEHGSHSYETAQQMIIAAKSNDCYSIVRTASNTESDILHAMDSGADGVLIPHINSISKALDAITYSKYYPYGKRGYSPYTRSGSYIGMVNHSEYQNNAVAVGLLIEGDSGISNLNNILNIRNITTYVDFIYIGAYDLSQSLGVPGQVYTQKVMGAMISAMNMIKSKGIAVGGGVIMSKDDMSLMQSLDMQFITLIPDCTALFYKYHDLLSGVK